MSIRVNEILARLSGVAHRGGAFSSEVLIAISEVLPDYPIVSLETGCGKSTVMFSNLASHHYVFAYDDRDASQSSVTMVQSDPEFQAANTTFVYGPTQRTLPGYKFPEGLMFDVILIDGPHGYPFPDLEYAILYDRLKPGGILILDDLHIASIGAMYDLLREDRMYEEIGVFSTTGLLKRSSIEGIPSDGDHWYEQNYNVSRFPLPMTKYHPDRRVEVGKLLMLNHPTSLAKLVVKAFEVDPSGTGARTTDKASILEADLGKHSGPITVDLTYRTIHEDAVVGSSIIYGTQHHPLPFHSQLATAKFRFDTVAGRPLRLIFMHPNATPEHDRGISRYDFRRLGVVVSSIRLRNSVASDGATAMLSAPSLTSLTGINLGVSSGKLPNVEGFKAVLEAYAAEFPYSTGMLEEDQIQAPIPLQQPLIAPLRFVRRGRDLHFGELLPFEGAAFADAAVWGVCGRRASPEQRLRVESSQGGLDLVKFLLEIDHQNRKDGRSTRLHGLNLGRRLWRTERWFRRHGFGLPAKWTNGLLKRYAKAKLNAVMFEVAQRRLLLEVLDKISVEQSAELRS